MKEHLYTIIHKEGNVSQGSTTHEIELNINHSVFKGHFPEQPVLPGVCQIGIITDLLESTSDTSLELVQSKNIKFLKMIDPRIMKKLVIETKILENEGGNIKISSNIQSHEGVCLKLKAVYKPS